VLTDFTNNCVSPSNDLSIKDDKSERATRPGSLYLFRATSSVGRSCEVAEFGRYTSGATAYSRTVDLIAQPIVLHAVAVDPGVLPASN
jgi:hypothetical protein